MFKALYLPQPQLARLLKLLHKECFIDQEIFQVCQQCSGSGKFKNKTCPGCNGSGRVLFGYLAAKRDDKSEFKKAK